MLQVLAVKEAEAEEAVTAVASLTAVLAEKDTVSRPIKDGRMQLPCWRLPAVIAEHGAVMTSHACVSVAYPQLFAQYEEQVIALEAIRHKEAAEAKALQAALDTQQQEWQQQLQAERSKRYSASTEACACQVQQPDKATQPTVSN
jgi:hypothetical protein